MNVIKEIEAEQIGKLTGEKEVSEFAPGDTVRVHVKVVEGTRERIQVFEGVVIARKNAGINSSFTVRKISYGEGVERVFPLYSPRIDHVEVTRRGRVRRAKLYYLRGLTGKRARITEKKRSLSSSGATDAKGVSASDEVAIDEAATKEEAAAKPVKKASKAKKTEES